MKNTEQQSRGAGDVGLLQNGVHKENPYRESFVRILKEHQEDEELMALFLEFALRLNTRRNEASRATRQ